MSSDYYGRSGVEMSWFERFKTKRRCTLCDAKLGKEPAVVEMQCADGLLKLKICDECFGVLDKKNEQAQELYNDEDTS